MFDHVNIRTKFMRGLVAKAISMLIASKTGYKVKINLDEINMVMDGDDANIHICGDVTMNIKELKKVETMLEEGL